MHLHALTCTVHACWRAFAPSRDRRPGVCRWSSDGIASEPHTREEARRLCDRRASRFPLGIIASGLSTPACPVYPTGGALVTAKRPCPPSAGPTAPLTASPALPSSRLDSSILHRPGRRSDQKGSAIYGSIRTLEPFQPPSASFTTIVPLRATVCKRSRAEYITIS